MHLVLVDHEQKALCFCCTRVLMGVRADGCAHCSCACVRLPAQVSAFMFYSQTPPPGPVIMDEDTEAQEAP